MTCGNHGDVTLILKPDSHLQMGKLVEIIGKVADLDNGSVCLIPYFLFLLLVSLGLVLGWVMENG